MGRRTALFWENRYESGVPRRERRSGEFFAYIPDPLQGLPLRVSAETGQAVARAERAVQRLGGARMHDLALVSRFLLRSEAIASSFIEGIAPNPKNIALAELSESDEPVLGLSEAAQQVARNMTIVRTATQALASVDQLTPGDLEELQIALVQERPDLQGVRIQQNWVGGSSYHPLEAAHVPPPAALLDDLMRDLTDYLSGAAHSPIIQAALAHAQFETIHPFPDGNGRVGRALIHTVLTRRGLTPDAVLPVSLILATRRDEYVAGLTAFRFEGEPDSPEGVAGINRLVTVFADAVGHAAEQALVLERELTQLRNEWQSMLEEGRRRAGRVRAPRRTSAVLMVLEGLPGTPILTPATVVRMHGTSLSGAASALSELAEYGILSTVSIGRGNRAYMSPDVLNLITVRERALASPAFDTAVSPPSWKVPALPPEGR